jgi:ribonuclease HI
MITVFTDGACDKNHKKENIGGWAYVILNEFGVKTTENSGKEINTTNNRMEMMAMLNALKAVHKNHKGEKAVIHSDSEYVINTLTKNWKRNKNIDLWDQIIPLMDDKITLKWVKGHAGNQFNEYVDKLAYQQTKDSPWGFHQISA